MKKESAKYKSLAPTRSFDSQFEEPHTAAFCDYKFRIACKGNLPHCVKKCRRVRRAQITAGITEVNRPKWFLL